MNLKNKVVHSVDVHTHQSYYTTTGIDITFTDGTVAHFSVRGSGQLATDIRQGEPPQKKVLPWKKNDQAFWNKLSEEDRKQYVEVKKAFFWLIDNARKVENHYTYRDKVWEEKYKIDGKRKQFNIEVDIKADDPKNILTIFFSSNLAPEGDDWFYLSEKKRDWHRILEMYKEVSGT
jgi:hypothetical protein